MAKTLSLSSSCHHKTRDSPKIRKSLKKMSIKKVIETLQRKETPNKKLMFILIIMGKVINDYNMNILFQISMSLGKGQDELIFENSIAILLKGLINYIKLYVVGQSRTGISSYFFQIFTHLVHKLLFLITKVLLVFKFE